MPIPSGTPVRSKRTVSAPSASPSWATKTVTVFSVSPVLNTTSPATGVKSRSSGDAEPTAVPSTVAYSTVTSFPAGADSEMVNWRFGPTSVPSATVASATATSGPTSLSVIVAVPTARARMALASDDSTRSNVSVPSWMRSPAMWTSMSTALWPATICSLVLLRAS
jgi:hypothetical protein